MKKKIKKEAGMTFLAYFEPTDYDVHIEADNGFYFDRGQDTIEEIIDELSKDLIEEAINVNTIDKDAKISISCGILTTKIFGAKQEIDIDFYDDCYPEIMGREEIIKNVKSNPHYKFSPKLVKDKEIEELKWAKKEAEADLKDSKRKLKEYINLSKLSAYKEDVKRYEDKMKEIDDKLKAKKTTNEKTKK